MFLVYAKILGGFQLFYSISCYKLTVTSLVQAYSFGSVLDLSDSYKNLYYIFFITVFFYHDSIIVRNYAL